MGYWLADAEQRKFYRINQNRSRAESEASEAWAERRAVPLKKTVRAIQEFVAHQATFWNKARGWAPKESATLLSSMRLECYASLALNLDETLLRPVGSKRRKLGRLILGWANLGSLLECTLQLFVGAWLRDYKKDERRVTDRRNPEKLEKLVLPHELSLESLRVLFDKSIWEDDERDRWGPWILRVQQRRNAIHALKPREMGDWSDLEEATRTYRDFLEDLDARLPEPDPEMESNGS